MNLWLDRRLYVGPYLALAMSQDEFDKCCKHIQVDITGIAFCNPDAYATTHEFGNADGQPVFIVGLHPAARKRDGVEVAALLVHEAVHIWQHVRAEIVHTIDSKNLCSLGAEFEAYAIQNIAQELMLAYSKRVTPKG